MTYIGIDAGGTKTSFILYDYNGIKMDQIVLGSCHFMKVGFDKMSDILMEGVTLLINRNNINHKAPVLSFGLAGYGREETVRIKIEATLRKTFSEFDYVLYNDIETAAEGAFLGSDGIMLIAGTGSIAFLKDRGKIVRSGGWGYLFGDEGSAYWLAMKMMGIFSKQDDGRRKRTFLHSHIKESLKLSQGYELISYVKNTLGNRRDEVASLAKLLYGAALKGDIDAIGIYEDAARELAELVLAVSRDLTSPTEVAVFGGVFNANKVILDPLRTFLPEKYNIINPKASPEYGAYLLAKKKFK